VRLEDLTLPLALEVCRAMRPKDRACIVAMRGAMYADAFAQERFDTDGPAWALCDGVGPILIAGLQFVSPWVATMWLLAHERADSLPATDETWRKLVRATRTVIRNALDPENPHARRRIEVHVLSDWPQARRLVHHLGFHREGTLRQAGSGGEDIEIWAQVAGGN
jgi:hypothetical protein